MVNENLYCPYSIELLFDFFAKLDIDINKKHSLNDKKKVLDCIEVLLNQKIIYVGENENGKLKEWNLPTPETLNKINEIWFEGAVFNEFYEMVWFGYQDWYVDALTKEGFGKQKMLWADFVKCKIGNLEKWIEENKPKE